MLTETYLRGNSFLHRADPRIKIFFLLFFSLFFFLPLHLAKHYAMIAFFIAAGTVSTGFSDILRPLKIVMPLLVLIILLTPPFHLHGKVYLTVFSRTVATSGGIYEAFHLAGRFVGLTLIFFIFLRTTKIEDLILSLRFFGLSYRIALIVSLTVRYIPFIASIYEGTIDAHRMRLSPDSAAISGWNFTARFAKLLSALTSVLIQAVKSIPNLAMALETRGVGRKNRPGAIKKMKSGKELSKELILSFLVISIMFSYILL